MCAGPDAIQQWVDAAAKNESMIQGAWVFMLECDYVWIKPMQVRPNEHFHTSMHALRHYSSSNVVACCTYVAIFHGNEAHSQCYDMPVVMTGMSLAIRCVSATQPM